ncbi:MBL fold metallo-hydrolase [Streptomyces incarnatus]
MGTRTAVRRLDPGCFVRPAAETGGPRPRVEPVLAYLVRHDRGLILFDTGIGDGEPQTEAHHRPRRRALRDALAASKVALDDISLVVNCHLHFDRCGGNPLLAGQAYDFASEQLARQAALQSVEQPLPPYRRRLDRLADFDPRRVLFAHDCSVWEPPELTASPWSG